MIRRISKNSERILAVLSQHRNPSQIAWGVAIGIVLGLIPKDNLIALLLIVLLASLRVNQLVACTTGLALSLLGGWFSPITAYVGTSILSQPLIVHGIAVLYRIPFLPWTCLDHSLVAGGIGVGTAMLVPSYVFCLWAFSRVNQKMETIALEQVANDAIEYRKSVVDQSMNRQKKPAKFNLILEEAPAMIADATTTTHATDLSQPSLDVANPEIESIPTKKKEFRFFGRAEAKRNHRTIPTIFTDEVLPDGNDTFLRETVIEVVRYRHPINVAKESVDNKTDATATSQTQGISMTVGNASTMESKVKASESPAAAASKAAAPAQSLAYDASHYQGHSGKSDESLKYLLWHINGSRETVRKSSEKTA